MEPISRRSLDKEYRQAVADAEGFPAPVIDNLGVFEICVQCRREYRYPHICREHHLCGMCHPEL